MCGCFWASNENHSDLLTNKGAAFPVFIWFLEGYCLSFTSIVPFLWLPIQEKYSVFKIPPVILRPSSFPSFPSLMTLFSSVTLVTVPPLSYHVSPLYHHHSYSPRWSPYQASRHFHKACQAHSQCLGGPFLSPKL